MSRIVSKYRTTYQGMFALRIPMDKWIDWVPSNSVSIDNTGTIIWWMDKPDGVLIQYPDGTRRFIGKQWLVEEGIVI